MTAFYGLPCCQSNAEGLNLPCSTVGCDEGVVRVRAWRRPRRERIQRRLEPVFVGAFYDLEIPLLSQITKTVRKSNTPSRIFRKLVRFFWLENFWEIAIIVQPQMTNPPRRHQEMGLFLQKKPSTVHNSNLMRVKVILSTELKFIKQLGLGPEKSHTVVMHRCLNVWL